MKKTKNSGNNLSFITKSKFEIKFKTDRWYYITNSEVLWLKKNDSEVFSIGTDTLTLFRSGNVNKISFRPIGSFIDAEKPIFRVETDKPGCCGSLLLKTLFTPWKMEIVEVNEELRRDFSLIQNFPFSTGWVYKGKVLESYSTKGKVKSKKGILIPPFSEEILFKEIRQILIKNSLISTGQY
jgi:glycine cleavage system H lipoate-binding protein